MKKEITIFLTKQFEELYLPNKWYNKPFVISEFKRKKSLKFTVRALDNLSIKEAEEIFSDYNKTKEE